MSDRGNYQWDEFLSVLREMESVVDCFWRGEDDSAPITIDSQPLTDKLQ